MGKSITLCIFLHGTILMHSSGQNCSREERVLQVRNKDPSIYDYSTYIPIGKAVEKLKKWSKQKILIIYLTFHKKRRYVNKDRLVLLKYDFPPGMIFYRKRKQDYDSIIERLKPDILIEDDCESIGGEEEMIITHLHSDLKQKLKSVVVKEFEGIDHLPDLMVDFNNI